MQTGDDGSSYLECSTSLGVVAFWGDDDVMINIEKMQSRRPPFRVRARCVQPDPPFDKRHSLWVTGNAPVDFV
ncbi:MAG TPA: hypothetical protein VKD69_10140 [Vicinamibacterales bacterium]|nr:hypothetical protein [Vicinamibacterales bacterium]